MDATHPPEPHPHLGEFEDPVDGYADDDLLTPDDLSVSVTGMTPSRSFLETEEFETELGGVEEPFEDIFNDISVHEIIQVIADGDRVGRPIVVVYAYRLPSSKEIDHSRLLQYLTQIIDKIVDQDYTIVYFHYGLRSHNKPPVRWLFQAYKQLDRRFKKNLKALYVVHPTRFIRIIFSLFKGFISSKFENKFHYVMCIDELENALSVSSILSHCGGSIPPIVDQLIEFLEAHALTMEGVFRKSANIGSIKRLQDRINKGERIDFENDPEYKDNEYVASLHASVLLKTFFRSLGEPLTTNKLYPRLAALSEVSKAEKSAAVKEFVKLLPRDNYILLKVVIKFLTKVADNSKVNLMTANNLSVVFGPNLTWPTDQEVPISQLNNLNNFCYKLIVDYDSVFDH
ncbi:CBN-RGA-1 protein [Caenorhabditis brenneri]|uniref:CBN-RGA-1 protein n=1 Tax=Caenorhabditis brenneri TaxID=135651 RepID=G0MV85_CAEBE|nr:CBN-RGA-1 protein [Caenorhabditis brenneri]